MATAFSFTTSRFFVLKMVYRSKQTEKKRVVVQKPYRWFARTQAIE